MYRQMGNSVAVPMIKEVADAMKEELFMALKLDGKKELRENYA